jgi:hypothetical protein
MYLPPEMYLPSGQVAYWCPRPDPNGSIRTPKWVGPLKMPLGGGRDGAGTWQRRAGSTKWRRRFVGLLPGLNVPCTFMV